MGHDSSYSVKSVGFKFLEMKLIKLFQELIAQEAWAQVVLRLSF